MKANLPQAEPRMLAKWEAADLYAQIRASRRGAPLYVLHDGPPYANGAIHLGTALNKIVKDFVVKTKTMSGFDSPYVPGWDCHGLPIEIKVDQELGSTRASLSPLDVRQACRLYAARFVDLHRQQFKRLGVFGQWDNPYLTMSPDFEASIADQILGFVRNGYAYKGLRAVYWCIHDRTALAEAEIEYEEHESPSIWVKYPFVSGKLPGGLQEQRGISAVIWTTTPWTLPASMALAFHPELEYVAVSVGDEIYVLAEALAATTAERCGFRLGEVLARFRGAAAEGLRFSHPWLKREVPAVLADYVTTDQGTGIVHTAPGHGAEDFATGERYGLEIVSPVDASGRFVGDWTQPFEGLSVFAANPKIVEFLRERGRLLGFEPLAHSYPHCWRCHNPVIFRATEQWFIGMDRHQLRHRTLEEIKTVKWIPAWGEERLANMVAARPDWCISRQRVWGVPIPVLSCNGCAKYLRSDAVDRRIVAVFAAEGSDSWFSRPASYFVPEGAACEHCGGTEFTQEKDIVDVWFESGSSQGAVLGHEPDLPWPADLYLEGGDQYRGWFQSSLLVAMGIRGAAPYRAVLTHGWVLDAEGRAMSKSLGNVIEPEEVVPKYGAEVLRAWVASVDYQEDVRISDEMLARLAGAYRKIRNTFRYLLSNLADFDPKRDALPDSELWELDRYMLRQAAHVARDCQRWYDEFAFHKVYHRLYDFCAVQLSAFYLDVLKDRLYTAATAGRARRSAQTALWKIAEVLVRLYAPLLPFTSDEVWSYMPATTLGGDQRGSSVHLERFVDTSGWLGSEQDLVREEQRWNRLLAAREEVLKALEAARREQRIGTSLEARVEFSAPAEDFATLDSYRSQLPALFIVSQVDLKPAVDGHIVINVERARGDKCERCWNYSTEVGKDNEYPTLCDRCRAVLAGTKV